jgi:putative transferase (TIGR04331 family)
MNNTQADETKKVFLATTALEEFWDTTKPIVFLGEWCLRYSRRSFWEQVDGELLVSPLVNDETAYASCRLVNKTYEDLLPLLGKALNSMHGTQYSERYWRIVVGPWLHFYISVVYDRYLHLKSALEKYPDCITAGLSQESFVAAADTLEFYYHLSEDSYNLQIYSKILTFLGKKFPRKNIESARSHLYENAHPNSLKTKLVNAITKSYASLTAIITEPIVLRQSYFPKPVELQLLLKSVGKVVSIWAPSTKQPRFQYDPRLRQGLQPIFIGSSEFEKCVSNMLFSDIPICFAEGFHALHAAAHGSYPKKIKAIFSATGWYFDETFKCWAAASADKGVKLLGTQHGGNYGGHLDAFSEDHEAAIVDCYYSWGWERTDCAAKVIPLPASKLLGRKKIIANNQKYGILWATTSSLRYLLEFPYLPNHYNTYLSWQCRFARILSSGIVSVLRVRPHRDDCGWDVVLRLKECIPGVLIETWDIPFQKSLENCRLYVCDHLSTTFAEALSANKPTILFLSAKANKLKPEARPYYDLLQKNGVLFDTPEDAAAAVNSVYADVETWWNAPERQAAIQVFCEQFARTSPDALDLWAAEFKRIANEASALT